ncbi:MAG: urea transporter [Bacteroidales bacterium]|nr:urea transporter [Bacteroidales bacterium]
MTSLVDLRANPVSGATFIDQVIKGISQIMLQDNLWTGLLFSAGLFIGNWLCASGALLATVSATLCARLFRFDKENIDAGLYGFSPALVGAALPFVFDMQLMIWLLIVVGGIAAALVQHIFIIKKLPGYTFPFILITWIVVYLLRQYSDVSSPSIESTATDTSFYSSLFILTNGFGQVIFQSYFLSGLLFFAGVLISSPLTAIYALGSSLFGALLAISYGHPVEQIQSGVFGFNMVLTAIVFAGSKKADAVWVLIGTFLTFVIHSLLIKVAFFDAAGGVFTFPFVAGTWSTLLLQKAYRISRST